MRDFTEHEKLTRCGWTCIFEPAVQKNLMMIIHHMEPANHDIVIDVKPRNGLRGEKRT